MPYSGPNDKSLPANVLKLSAVRRRQWLHVYNSEKAGGASDADAIVRANGVIKKQMGHSMAVGKNDASLLADIGVMLAAGVESVEIEGYEDIVAGLHDMGDMTMPMEDGMPDKVPQDQASYDPFGGAGGKGCATCRWFMPPTCCHVVDGVVNPGGVSDLYMAEDPETSDISQTQLVDSAGDTIDFQGLFDELSAGGMSLEAGWHATWTQSYQNNLPDSSFAFIDPGGKKDAEGKTTPRSLRHFPYKDASGTLDEAHVRDALGRVPQSHVSAVGKHAALVKLHAAARTLGIKLTADAPMASAAANDGGIGTVAKGAYQKILGFLGLEDLARPSSWTERIVKAGEQGMPELVLHEGTGDEPGILLTPEGRLRYWTVASNSIDGDNKGLGFPAAAQQEYVDWVWQHPEERMPELQGWHTPGTRLGQADWIDFDGRFRHSTGLIDAGLEEIAIDLASDPDMAMSFGYVVVWDQHNRAKVFRSYEESILPREYAGNSFTSFGLEEGGVAFSEPRKKFLHDRFGLSETEIAARENRWDQFGTVLESLGIGFHELELYVASAHADDGEQQPTAQGMVVQPAAAPADSGAAAQGEQLATEIMTPESLREMLSSVVQAQLAPLAQTIHGLQEHQSRVEQLLPNARSAQPAGYDATKGANGQPVLSQGAGGQPVVGQQSADGAPLQPLDPNVLKQLAAGAQEIAGGAQEGNAVDWMFSRLAGQHPLLNGQPTERRG